VSAERFTIDYAPGWTECFCPPALCSHTDPVGMRSYDAWTIWDNERDEHAFVTVSEIVLQPEYEKKREAREDLRRLVALLG
jgi:hypothetical protein